MVKNDDRPGMIGIVGTLLGNAGVNIADMDVGAAADGGTAVMLIATSGEVRRDRARPTSRRRWNHFGRRADLLITVWCICGSRRVWLLLRGRLLRRNRRHSMRTGWRATS